jgi:hypothetical protein
MITRDEYVEKTKAQLDVWNAELAKWQDKAKTAHEDMKPQIDRQIELVKQHRENALYQMKLFQAAAGDAWEEMAKGADEAWASMREAFDKASSHFTKK